MKLALPESGRDVRRYELFYFQQLERLNGSERKRRCLRCVVLLLDVVDDLHSLGIRVRKEVYQQLVWSARSGKDDS